jgi:hypothetical protein
MQTPEELASQLAARLLTVQQQKKAIESEESEIKTRLERLHADGAIPTRQDISMLFSDNQYHTVRLLRQKTGTYFKVLPDHKEAFAAERQKLESKYLKDGRAETAEKSPTWKVSQV